MQRTSRRINPGTPECRAAGATGRLCRQRIGKSGQRPCRRAVSASVERQRHRFRGAVVQVAYFPPFRICVFTRALGDWLKERGDLLLVLARLLAHFILLVKKSHDHGAMPQNGTTAPFGSMTFNVLPGGSILGSPGQISDCAKHHRSRRAARTPVAASQNPRPLIRRYRPSLRLRDWRTPSTQGSCGRGCLQAFPYGRPG